MTSSNSSNGTKRWFSISMLLLGIIVGGFSGIVRGDWLGRDAAKVVEHRVESHMQERFSSLKEDIQEIKADVKELLKIRD